MKIFGLQTALLCVIEINFIAAHPTNYLRTENGNIRYIDDDVAESEIMLMTKVEKYSGNKTENELQMLLPYKSIHAVEGTLKCSVCKLTLKYALWKYRKPDGTYDGLPEFVGSACKHLKIETDNVCDGIVTTYKQVVLTLLHDLQLSAEQVCGLILPSTCYSPDLPWNKIKWNVTIPGTIPRPLQPNPDTPPPSSGKTARVLHLSDIHVDRNYKPGAAVDCSEPLCCRDNSEMKAESRSAGYWGSLGYCDTPPWTLVDLLQHVSKNTYDYILWTGDLPAHNDWSQSKEEQTNALFNLTQLLVKYFPRTPIYPSLGNHESFPVNNFPPHYIHDKNSISWLYSALKKAWSPWLPADALETVSQSGCYTTLIKPKFRIVSLNMNFCNQQNWWMLINPVDPNHELQWLVEVLLKAEENGEKVHILGHIPPGCSDCLPIWSRNYYNIVNRFQHVITAQFFGHTHADQVELFYDEQSKQIPTSLAYIAPSVTTFFNMHPGYREYTVDGLYDESSWTILDHSTFILNLTKANSLPPTHPTSWEFLYSAKETYGLKDLSPHSWNQLVKSWISGKADDTFQRYYYYFYKGFPPTPKCDESCKKDMLCDIRAARSGDAAEFCSHL